MTFDFDKKDDGPHPSEYSPKYWLHRHLCRTEPARQYDYVHASDLMKPWAGDFCARERCLGLEYGVQLPDQKIYTHENVTFAYGYAVEDLVRQWFTEMGVAVGHWECRHCNQLHKFQKRPDTCSGCGHHEMKYREVKFISTYSGVGCRPDLFIDFGWPKLTLIEIKSIDKEEIKKLHAPLAEHRWRTSLYLRIIAESDNPYKDLVDTEDAFIIYISKGGYGFKDDEIRRWKLSDGDWSPFREFPVTRDDKSTDALVEQGRCVDIYKKGGPIPKGICPTAFVKRAKYCKMHDQCWGGKHP